MALQVEAAVLSTPNNTREIAIRAGREPEIAGGRLTDAPAGKSSGPDHVAGAEA